ncbi:hypothetical protein LINPERHAP2_LOCUS3824 [Linum perenne]
MSSLLMKVLGKKLSIRERMDC